MDRLVTVDVKEVQIIYRRGRRCCSSEAALSVTNLMHTMSVAVHLSSTRPSTYSFHPSTPALLPPLSSTAFTVILSPTTCPPPSPPDALFIRSALVPTGRADAAALRRLFARPFAAKVFHDAVVPVALLGADVVDSVLDESSVTLEANFVLSRAASACSTPQLSALLRRAAGEGKHQFLSALVAAGADVSARGKNGESSLGLAVAARSVESAAALLDFGAKLDPHMDLHLLHAAAASGCTEILKLIVASLATAAAAWGNAADKSGRTPLHLAVEKGNLTAVEFIVAAGGADVDRADAKGWTPLHCAAAAGSLELVEYLLEKSSYDGRLAKTKKGRKTAHDVAAEHGHQHLLGPLRPGGEKTTA